MARLAKHPGAGGLACRWHDEAYYYGGSEQDKDAADRLLRVDWDAAGLPYWFMQAGFDAVQKFGGPEHKIKLVSFGYGGEVFRYLDAPLVAGEEIPE